MKNLTYLLCVCVLGLGALFGCGKDPDRPSTLAEQQNLMNGSHKPSKEQLAEAMSHIHLPGPAKAGTPQAPGH
jgi:hypothetical protein